MNGNAEIIIQKVYFDHEKNRYFNDEIVEYSKEYNYEFDENPAQAFLHYDINLFKEKEYALGVSFHNYGYEESTMSMASFFELKKDSNVSKTLALELPPHVLSLEGDIESKKKNVKKYLEKAMTKALAKIASTIKQ